MRTQVVQPRRYTSVTRHSCILEPLASARARLNRIWVPTLQQGERVFASLVSSPLSSSATPRWGSFVIMNMKKVRITCIQNKNFKYRPAPLQPPIPWNRLQGGYVYTHKKTDYSIKQHHAISFLSSHGSYFNFSFTYVLPILA